MKTSRKDFIAISVGGIAASLGVGQAEAANPAPSPPEPEREGSKFFPSLMKRTVSAVHMLTPDGALLALATLECGHRAPMNVLDFKERKRAACHECGNKLWRELFQGK